MHSKYQPAAHMPQSVATFTHLTIQTGRVVEQTLFPSDLQESVRLLLPSTDAGCYVLFERYTLIVFSHSRGHRSFSVWHGKNRLMMCEACVDSNYCDEVWQSVLSNVRRVSQSAAESGNWPEHILKSHFQTPVLRKPQGLFLAVWLDPVTTVEHKARVWLDDFESYFYLALWNRLQMDSPACLAGKPTHENGATQPAKN